MFARAAAVLVTALMLAGCSTSRVVETAEVQAMGVDSAAAAAWISRHRAMHNLGPVTVDSSLIRAAEYQALAVGKAGHLSHSVGGEFSSRLAAVGFDRQEGGPVSGDHSTAGDGRGVAVGVRRAR